MIKMISSNERPLRLAFKELVTLIEASAVVQIVGL